MYTTEPCGYCVAAKKLLDDKGISYDEVNLARDPEGRRELAKKTGNFTFPQILVDDENVGGLTDLKDLERQGLLEEKLGG